MKELLSGLLQRATALGAQDADAIVTRRQSLDANVYKGEVDEYNHAQTQGVGLRVFLGGRVGYAYSESLLPQDMEELATSAVANAEVSDPDPDAGLFPGPYGDSGSGEYDTALHEAQVLDTVKSLYASLSQHELVEDVMRCAAGVGTAAFYYANTRGAYLHQGYQTCEVVAAPIVQKGDYRETGMDFYAGKTIEGVDLSALTRQSVDRGMRYDGAVPTQSRACPVVIHAEAFTDLIATFSSIFSAQKAQDGLSLFRGKEGTPVAADCVTLTDSPYSPIYGYTSLFDGEGVPKVERDLIHRGVLTTLLYDVKTARKAGKAPTGNGARGYSSTVMISPNNLVLQPGTDSLSDLAQKAGNGVLLYEVSGLHAGANPTSGDFSLLCKGREIVDGELATPFTQAVVSGNFYQLLKDIQAVGNDGFTSPSPAASITTPSVLVKSLSMAGQA
jgi:PmbA protein